MVLAGEKVLKSFKSIFSHRPRAVASTFLCPNVRVAIPSLLDLHERSSLTHTHKQFFSHFVSHPYQRWCHFLRHKAKPRYTDAEETICLGQRNFMSVSHHQPSERGEPACPPSLRRTPCARNPHLRPPPPLRYYPLLFIGEKGKIILLRSKRVPEERPAFHEMLLLLLAPFYAAHPFSC